MAENINKKTRTWGLECKSEWFYSCRAYRWWLHIPSTCDYSLHCSEKQSAYWQQDTFIIFSWVGKHVKDGFLKWEVVSIFKWIATVENDSYIFNWEFIFKQLSLLKSGKTMRHDGKTPTERDPDVGFEEVIKPPWDSGSYEMRTKSLLCRLVWGSYEIVFVKSQNSTDT